MPTNSHVYIPTHMTVSQKEMTVRNLARTTNLKQTVQLCFNKRPKSNVRVQAVIIIIISYPKSAHFILAPPPTIQKRKKLFKIYIDKTTDKTASKNKQN